MAVYTSVDSQTIKAISGCFYGIFRNYCEPYMTLALNVPVQVFPGLVVPAYLAGVGISITRIGKRINIYFNFK